MIRGARALAGVFFVFFISACYGQKGLISGEIIDEEINEYIPYANVSLINSDFSRTITGGISDEKGQFELTKSLLETTIWWFHLLDMILIQFLYPR
jgi:hypothetical protein